MRLEKWLRLNQMQIHEFAKMIGKTRSLVHKYIYENVMPKHDVMMKIYHVTLESVSPNDFYRVSEVIFDDENFQKTRSHSLETWLRLNKMQIHEFAKVIGKTRSLVHKYIYEDVIPRPDVMMKIYRATLRSVSPNDFYRVSEVIFEEKDFQKAKFYSREFEDDAFK